MGLFTTDTGGEAQAAVLVDILGIYATVDPFIVPGEESALPEALADAKVVLAAETGSGQCDRIPDDGAVISDPECP